jgi:hypothetical protein
VDRERVTCYNLTTELISMIRKSRIKQRISLREGIQKKTNKMDEEREYCLLYYI